MTTYNPGDQFTPNSGYGDRVDPKNTDKIEFHPGQDYKAPAGTEIPAASSGVVVYSGYNPSGYGNTVIIKSQGADDSYYYTLYAHQNGNNMPAVGSMVNQGDAIGQVRSTGRSTGNHLHFEVINGDAPIRHQAMMFDGNLKTIVNQFSQATTASARQALIDALIYHWAGVENVNPNSRAASQLYGNVIGDGDDRGSKWAVNDNEWRGLV